MSDFIIHYSIKIIEHKKEIGGRFSIFSNVSLIPGFYFHEELIDLFFEGARKGLTSEKDAKDEADKDFNLINRGKMINASLIYGDELNELANWKKHNKKELLGHNLIQWHLDRQWKSIRKLAKNLGISLFGDVPFYLSLIHI